MLHRMLKHKIISDSEHMSTFIYTYIIIYSTAGGRGLMAGRVVSAPTNRRSIIIISYREFSSVKKWNENSESKALNLSFVNGNAADAY